MSISPSWISWFKNGKNVTIAVLLLLVVVLASVVVAEHFPQWVSLSERELQGQPSAFLITFRGEAAESGVDARRATKGRAGVLVQSVERAEGQQRSRHAAIRRRSRSVMRNAG